MTGVSKVPLIYGRSGVRVDVQIMSPPHLNPLPPRGEEVLGGGFHKFRTRDTVTATLFSK